MSVIVIWTSQLHNSIHFKHINLVWMLSREFAYSTKIKSTEFTEIENLLRAHKMFQHSCLCEFHNKQPTGNSNENAIIESNSSVIFTRICSPWFNHPASVSLPHTVFKWLFENRTWFQTSTNRWHRCEHFFFFTTLTPNKYNYRHVVVPYRRHFLNGRTVKCRVEFIKKNTRAKKNLNT